MVKVGKGPVLFLADRSIDTISVKELLDWMYFAELKREKRGIVETAHTCLQYCGQIFSYAIATDRASHDVSADLNGRNEKYLFFDNNYSSR
jgi:hypothetical protein